MEAGMKEFIDYLYLQSEQCLRFDASDPTAWQRNLKGKLAELISLDKLMCFRGLRQSQIEEQDEFTDYTRQRITLTLAPHLHTALYLLYPKNGTKNKVVLCCHGHGGGVNDVLDETCTNGWASYQKHFPISLVKRGYLTVVPEIIGFGNTVIQEIKTGQPWGCYPISQNLLMMGYHIVGLRVFQLMAALDHVFEHCQVAPKAGVIGVSGGGLLSLLMAVFDNRIQAAVVSGYLNDYYSSLMSKYHCSCNYIPGILEYAELTDIFGLAAPKSMLVSNGTHDCIFPIESAKKAFAEVQKIYTAFGAEERLESEFFYGIHRISGPRLYDFFDRLL